MFQAGAGHLAMNFNQTGLLTQGSLTSGLKRPPEISVLRERAEQTIKNIAKSQNVSPGVIVHKVLSQSIPELQSYVQARGENPSDNLVKLAIQAALLRSTEVGTVSKALDISDVDALQVVEKAEQEHVEDNTAETSSILSPDTAAALSLLMYRIAKRFKQRGGSGALKDFVYTTKNAAQVDNFNNVSCAYLADCFTGVNNSTGGGGLFYYPEQEQEVTGGVTQTDPEKGSFWSDLFGGIDNVVDAITKVSGAINTTVGNVKNTSGGIIDSITDIGGTVGAKSIDQYLRENWLKIVGVLVAIILLTIIFIRATRK